MKANQAFGDLESREFVVVNDLGDFFAPATGRNARYKSQWTQDLGEATVYKTWQHAEKAIQKHGLEFAKYTSLKEARVQ